MEAQVIPRLFTGKTADGAVRVWVPGCATGEEAYSLAILLREHMDRLERRTESPGVRDRYRRFGDRHCAPGALSRTLLEGLSAERRAAILHASQGSYVVTKEIRDLCTFSTHNLVRDPPFSRWTWFPAATC